MLTPIAAFADNGDGCADELHLNVPMVYEAENKVPVILVHGWISSAKIWNQEKTSILKSLESENVEALTFDYETNHSLWVTGYGDNTDVRLAKTIACYSKLYNDKKVVIVAHSMGGLLTRAALDRIAYGQKAKFDVGHIITIGTPHLGSASAGIVGAFANTKCMVLFGLTNQEMMHSCMSYEARQAAVAMSPGSPQLKVLPKFPSWIPVLAIAGEVMQTGCVSKRCNNVSTGSDLVVSVASATAEHYKPYGYSVGGMNVFQCVSYVAVELVSNAWCEHSYLVQAPEVQTLIKNSIETYIYEFLARDVLPAHSTYLGFDRFNLPLLNDWQITEEIPGQILDVVDTSTCGLNGDDCISIEFANLDSRYGNMRYEAPVGPPRLMLMILCGSDDTSRWVDVQSLQIGGQSGESYRLVRCVDTTWDAPYYMWWSPSYRMVAFIHDGGKSDRINITLDHVSLVLERLRTK